MVGETILYYKILEEIGKGPTTVVILRSFNGW